ncbi:MAG: NUDIX domain-containing protein [Pseudomonadota bacterium]|nr:NUDIX domain-containing protein [Gammaproteobacteria bacterium]MBU1558817.1 NUDIX domain-containing protein [Gammaproteobacteria bacterium]MBU1629322.1 NUDIX domain-containing protein [Gammaproteobacteria bacterium]MBU1926997.1 NUDIX domain-containing protein [Gammaproteobacteria bacterium]MBU2546106.1 NUDIX domain-containing protein [Gammaproteobacteria bacterium]
MTRIQVIPAVYLFLARENQILMLRRYNTGYADGLYSFVAGHVEGNESLKQAMVREAKEEAGIDIDIGTLTTLHTMHRHVNDETNRIDVFMTSSIWKGEPTNMEPTKCDHLDWFSQDRIPTNTVPYVSYAIQQIQQGIPYSEFGF